MFRAVRSKMALSLVKYIKLRPRRVGCAFGTAYRAVRCIRSAGDAKPDPTLQKPGVEPAWKPYMELARMDKPIGSLLLFWPCCWGVALATPAAAMPDIVLMVSARKFLLRPML